ncbi:PAS/PAC sensor hybrid histidine kinase [Trichormus variabilis ATCC 29413]|uniref:Circadian input-output histidine kinase CikA n=2 Tax=Anabaena variabilis TaxID=264691 RepID=Q3M7G2_TRIV2|nr:MULTISPECIES: PAS domain S-box protein [Nostocaceae]ABA23074.1 PAS/PAC sensor hybrid histidine kinase [Trichormus variabilis ATCC 29413]MBC1216000.1 PAS domain S-box protein [Trichormus variabilis ARAD]MBC1255908.1 PAS domain S-box protein [Trichormus variabilis V5]MBC1265696.1 PAS domain S-box protein [Trichormus variabilis FSR]MBC1303449.1 PAS domain S-box protein [Trichormus variabilis N2B]
MSNVDQVNYELADEVTALRQRIAELEQLEKQYQYKQVELERRIEDLQAKLRTPNIANVDIERHPEPVTLQRLQQEISQRQQVDAALTESEERWRLALDAANLGFWDWNVLTEKVVWSENHELLFGLVPGSFDGAYETFLCCVHPEDRESVMQVISACLNNKTDYYDEFRIVWPEKSIHWIAAKGRFFYNEQGQPVRMIGVCMDITESKRSEENTRQLATQVQEQANILNAILATSVDHIYILNRTGHYQYVSYGGAAVLGLHPQQMIGKTVQEIDLPQELIDKMNGQFLTVMKVGEPIKDECEYVAEDGKHYYEYILTPLRNVNHSIEGVITVSRDMTEHKRAEQSIRNSEARFRRLFESNLIGVAFWNVDGFITDANDAYLQIVGYTREEFDTLGKINWRELTPPDCEHLDTRAIAEVKANGISRIYEKQYIQRNGRRVSIVLGIALLDDSDEQGVAFVLDISERKLAEQQRDRLLCAERIARKDAEIANRIKDEFLAVLSHELRTPLNPILGWSKLLRSRQFDAATTDRALETIERNATLQTQLIEDLLDVSRILQGKLSLNVCPVSLPIVIGAAIDTVRLAAEAKEIKIQNVFDPELGQVMGDANRLQQVVWNLLSNAVKFTSPGGTVEIHLKAVNDQAQIQVIDTGKGITPEFLPYVFDYFRQADGTTTRKFGGLGLGLAIVRQVVELHGGTVQATSPGEGLGATFTVNLPLSPKHEAMNHEDKNPVSANFQPATLSGVRVLIVDDEPDIRDLVTFILEDYDVEVIAVSSAQEALEALSQSLPDIIVSDIGMPDVDGYMLMRQLRQRSPQEGGNLPAIALTAYAGEMNQQQALAAGFQLHISKPVDPDALIEAIGNLVNNQ